MPKWSEYLAHAKERGSLAFEVYRVVSTPNGDMDLLQRTLPDHLRYIGEREADGAIMLAGPLSDETGEEMQGVGMLILRAESLEAAKALADGDPMHSSGARSYTIRKWMINEGAINIQVRLGGQKAAFG
ncbi:MAG: YciI family protein [Pseudomonadota bacterium]